MPRDARAFLIVEGETDREYLRLAAAKATVDDPLEGIAILPTGGTTKLVTQLLLVKQLTNKPVAALLDYDEEGKRARDWLIKLGFDKAKEIISYKSVFPPGADLSGEAEDLWPEHLHQEFLAKHGDGILVERRRLENGSWHYGYGKVGKELIVDFLQGSAKKSDIRLWLDLIQTVRGQI